MNPDSESEGEKRSLRARFREESSREILAAAEAVFAEQGLHNAQVAQIAERAGVAVGTLYNRFKDRQTLLEALLTARRCELLAKLDERLKLLADADFEQRLAGILQTLFEHAQEHQAFLAVVFASEHNSTDKRRQFSQALYDRLERVLKQGHARGALRADPRRMFATTLMGTVKAVLERETYGLPPLAPTAAAREVLRNFLHGASR